MATAPASKTKPATAPAAPKAADAKPKKSDAQIAWENKSEMSASIKSTWALYGEYSDESLFVYRTLDGSTFEVSAARYLISYDGMTVSSLMSRAYSLFSEWVDYRDKAHKAFMRALRAGG